MEIFPKNERSVKREERYFKQQGNIEFFRRAETASFHRPGVDEKSRIIHL